MNPLLHFILLIGMAVAVLGQKDTTAPTTNNATVPTCNGAVCNADQYCYQKDPMNNATHQCIPLTYPCGGRTCANNNETFCSLNTNACTEYQNLCGGLGVVTDEQNCNDGTRYSRWPMAGDLSSVSVATLCGLDCDGKPTDETTGGDSSGTTTVVRNISWMVAFLVWLF